MPDDAFDATTEQRWRKAWEAPEGTAESVLLEARSAMSRRLETALEEGVELRVLLSTRNEEIAYLRGAIKTALEQTAQLRDGKSPSIVARTLEDALGWKP